jgi:hypothetical protein
MQRPRVIMPSNVFAEELRKLFHLCQKIESQVREPALPGGQF